MPELDERIRQWLLKRAKSNASGKILTKGVMRKLRAEVMDDPVSLRKTLSRLRNEGHIEFTSDDRGEPISSYIEVAKPVQATPDHVLRWTSVLIGGGLGEDDVTALTPIADTLSDLSEIDMENLLDGLVKLRNDQTGLIGRPAFLVSAEYLLGSSKLLTNLPRRALKAFGIDPSRFPSHPLYVVVAGPAAPDAVVLVENPAALERAVSTKAIERCAFIATFGFGLSNAEEDYGNQLAGMVEDSFTHAITLRRAGSACPDARDLLSHGNITFWGDLDPAGIEIYLRLKKTVPKLRLSRLYKPMTELVAHPKQSHPYVQSVGKERQTSMSKSDLDGDTAASWLRGLCTSRGVDQEAVSVSDIENLAQLPLSIGQVHA